MGDHFMSEIPKHEPSKRTRGAKKTCQIADMPDSSPFVDMTSVAEAVDGLRSVISTYVTQARNGDNAQPLYSDPSGYPVKVQLTAGTDEEDCTVWIECEALDRLATAFERIADAMQVKP